ncbi:MAG: MFS transporter [Nocardioides sp.]|nr:MFS transporter [Nocardioides sp.]
MSPTFKALRSYNYRLYLAGSIVSNVGTWMMRIAQDWLVLSLHGGGGTDLGITTGLQFLPVLLLTPYAGVIADRLPKRRLLQIAQAGMAVVSFVLAMVALSGVATIPMVYALAFLFGVCSAFETPTRQAFVSEMVHADDLTNAIGLNSASFNSARLVGPALAGLIIGWLGSGAQATGWVMMFNAVSYVATIVQVHRMRASELNSPRLARRASGQFREGLAYIRTQPAMMMILVIVFFAGTFGMNFAITSALMATQVFHKGAGEYGILGSALAVGSLLGALMGARRANIRLRLIVLAAVAFGLAEIVSGLVPTYVTFAITAPFVGISMMTLLNSANATMQKLADPALRGRVMAIYMTVVMGGTPIGAPIVGAVGQHLGARWTLLLGGVLVLVGAGIGVLFLVRRRTVLTPSHAAG